MSITSTPSLTKTFSARPPFARPRTVRGGPTPSSGGKVIDDRRDTGRTQGAEDQRLDLGPDTSGQAAADPWHVDRRVEGTGVDDQGGQALVDRLVADRRAGAGLVAGAGAQAPARPDAVLADHVGHPEIRRDRDQLHRTQTEGRRHGTTRGRPTGALAGRRHSITCGEPARAFTR